jgi:predicted DNA-binding transcriptional regulator AlpA
MNERTGGEQGKDEPTSSFPTDNEAISGANQPLEIVSARSIVFGSVDNPTAPAAPYASWEEAAQDPLARPLTFPQVVKRTGRSRRTISSWIHEGVLTPYRLAEGTRMVRVFLERQVLEVDRAKRDAAAASRLNLAQRRLTAHRADNPPHLE